MLEVIIKSVITVVCSMALGGVITYLTTAGKLKCRVRDLEKWRGFIQADTNESIEERRILLKSVLACLKGLQEQGCNGPVSKGIEELETYINQQAHRPRSYTKSEKGGTE